MQYLNFGIYHYKLNFTNVNFYKMGSYLYIHIKVLARYCLLNKYIIVLLAALIPL